MSNLRMTSQMLKLLAELIERYQHHQRLLEEWYSNDKPSGKYPLAQVAWVEIGPDGGTNGAGHKRTAEALVSRGLAEWCGDDCRHLVLADLTKES